MKDKYKILDNSSMEWILLISWMTIACVLGPGESTKPASEPSFVDPVKNISVQAGSSIEFFCNVRNLGGFRVMWLKIDEGKETLMAINNLKVTKNPRVTVSLLPSSGELTQSILYVNNVEKEDDGAYHCIVNTSPNTVQVGTLEVKEIPVAETESPEIPPVVKGSSDGGRDYCTTSEEREETEGGGVGGADNAGVFWLNFQYNVQYLFTTVFSSVKSIL